MRRVLARSRSFRRRGAFWCGTWTAVRRFDSRARVEMRRFLSVLHRVITVLRFTRQRGKLTIQRRLGWRRRKRFAAVSIIRERGWLEWVRLWWASIRIRRGNCSHQRSWSKDGRWHHARSSPMGVGHCGCVQVVRMI